MWRKSVASGHAAAKASRTREAVSMTRVAKLLQKHVEKVGAQRMPVRAARHGLLQNSIDELRIGKQSLHPQSGLQQPD
jgi:hypothetical protein